MDYQLQLNCTVINSMYLVLSTTTWPSSDPDINDIIIQAGAALTNSLHVVLEKVNHNDIDQISVEHLCEISDIFATLRAGNLHEVPINLPSTTIKLITKAHNRVIRFITAKRG